MTQQPPEQPSAPQPPSGFSQPPGYGQGPGLPQGYPQGYVGRPPLSPSDENLWSVLSHLAWVVGAIVVIAPLGPLAVYLVFRDRSAVVRRNSAEALNFWITIAIALAVSTALTVVGIGLLLLPVVGIYAFVLSIVAALAARRGEEFHYPLTLRLVH